MKLTKPRGIRRPAPSQTLTLLRCGSQTLPLTEPSGTPMRVVINQASGGKATW